MGKNIKIFAVTLASEPCIDLMNLPVPFNINSYYRNNKGKHYLCLSDPSTNCPKVLISSLVALGLLFGIYSPLT